MAAAALLTISVSATAAAFETPEAAVREYGSGGAQADVAQVLEATAVDEIAEGYRLEQMVDQLEVFHPALPGPVHDPFFADIQRAVWTERLLVQTQSLAYGLLAPETLTAVAFLGEAIDGVDAAWATNLMAELDPARLSSLEVVDIKVPAPGTYHSDVYRRNLARAAEMYSADEWVERVALVEFEGDLYEVGFTLVRYGDEWKVQKRNSILAGLSAGGVKPTTIEQWDELTSE
jgi:hypothetical protein